MLWKHNRQQSGRKPHFRSCGGPNVGSRDVGGGSGAEHACRSKRQPTAERRDLHEAVKNYAHGQTLSHNTGGPSGTACAVLRCIYFLYIHTYFFKPPELHRRLRPTTPTSFQAGNYCKHKSQLGLKPSSTLFCSAVRFSFYPSHLVQEECHQIVKKRIVRTVLRFIIEYSRGNYMYKSCPLSISHMTTFFLNINETFLAT